MKRFLLLMSVSLGLAACAAPAPGSLAPKDIRSDSNLRKEVVIEEFNFPQVQSRLFKHREHCQISFDFSLDPRQVHYVMAPQTNPTWLIKPCWI